MTPTTPSPISDQAAGEPVAWPKLTDEMARAFYSAYNIAHEHRGAFESVLAGYNAMQHVSTAPTTGSAPVGYFQMEGDGRFAHIDARYKDDPDVFPLYAAAGSALSGAVFDVLGERRRQVTAEGWTPEHDDEHEDSEMALAAIVYAESAVGYHVECPDTWPWSPNWFKPTTPRRDLVKAGALILAEIERLDRIALLAASMGGDRKSNPPVSEA